MAPAIASSNGTTSTPPKLVVTLPSPNHSTLQCHPTMAPSNGTTSTAPCNGTLVPRPMRQSGSSPFPPIGSKNPYSYRYLGNKNKTILIIVSKDQARHHSKKNPHIQKKPQKNLKKSRYPPMVSLSILPISHWIQEISRSLPLYPSSRYPPIWARHRAHQSQSFSSSRASMFQAVLENLKNYLDENGFKPFCWSKHEINQSNRIKNRLEKKQQIKKKKLTITLKQKKTRLVHKKTHHFLLVRLLPFTLKAVKGSHPKGSPAAIRIAMINITTWGRGRVGLETTWLTGFAPVGIPGNHMKHMGGRMGLKLHLESRGGDPIFHPKGWWSDTLWGITGIINMLRDKKTPICFKKTQQNHLPRDIS